MTDYRAPWSRAIKYTTLATNLLIAVICVGLTALGVFQIRSGHPMGWFLIVQDLWLPAIPLLVRLWAPRGYRITDDAVVVLKRIGDDRYPFEKIAAVEIWDSKDVFRGAIRTMGSGGYYGAFGSFSGPALSNFNAQVTDLGVLVVLRMKHGEPVVLSPENPHDFARQLSSRAGIAEQDKETQVQVAPAVPVPLAAWEWALETLSVMFLLAGFAAVVVLWDELPATVPVHFDISGKPNGWGSKSSILIGPATALVLYVFMTWISAYTYRKISVTAANPKTGQTVMAMRGFFAALKCFITGVAAYTTWQTGLMAVGRGRGLGAGFAIVITVVAVLLAPAAAIYLAVRSSRSRNSAGPA